MKINYIKQKSILLLTLTAFSLIVNGQTATTTISPTTIINNNTKPLLGITMDSRTGMDGTTGYVGYFNSLDSLISNIDTLFNDFPLNGIRYPGQAIMLGFEWKKSIGTGTRPNQNLLGSLGPSQAMDFGFDEFMAYCESKGLYGENIQIMVPIYDSAVTYYDPTSTFLLPGKNNARVPFPANNAADWVEYANCPDTANWGGGVAWGAMRSANGHPAPYNIKTWNIGNEPWGPGEMNFDTTQYFPIAKPIIDSMLARDPSIHITVPAVGPVNSNWNIMVRKHKLQYGDIYGISPHFFSNMLSVDNIESTLSPIIDSANAYGLKVILGDYSHEILNGSSALDKNRAMSWKGVNFATDMLLMVSQLNTIERANHWGFGMTITVWQPIRKEISGIYTLLPVGEFYKILSPYFLNNSLNSVSVSPIASDGHPYSLRASAFGNTTNDTISVIAINRDTLNSLTYSVNGLSSYSLFDSKILTSDSLTGELIYSNAILPDINGDFNMPASSILLLSYSLTATSINQFENNTSEMAIFPNPFTTHTVLQTDIYLKNAELSIYNCFGQKVKQINHINGQTITLSRENLAAGFYFVRLKADNKQIVTKKIMITD